MTACAKCGREVEATHGAAGWCITCERADLAMVLRRDGGVQPREAFRLAQIVLERDMPVAGRVS